MPHTPSPKTIVITGASDGIGAAAARRLHVDGHHVIVVGRSPEKTRVVAQAIDAPSFTADFAVFSQVRKLAGDLRNNFETIDVLVNNAGGVFGQRSRTVDGFEKTLQVNHLTPFLLTNLLLPTLIASKASVIQTSSIAARIFGHINLDDLDNDRNASANKAYGDAKLANILFTKELHRRFAVKGLSAAAFHPGVIATSFASDTTSAMRFVYNSPIAKLFFGSPERGARQLVWLAEGTPGTDWQSGEYYESHKPAKRVNPQTHDVVFAGKLWQRSEELVGSPFDVTDQS